MSTTTLKWYFPPTSGGIAQGFNDSGKEFFTADVLEHVVREIIQNSLDAKDPRYPDSPVVVSMNKMEMERDAINTKDLTGHISEALKSTREKNNKKGSKFYETALEMLKKTKIPVLAVIDENTTGLDDTRWSSLVYEEGTTSKDNKAAGGSFGIGKNAPYAASALGLLCYSTRYPNKHRVEKFIARCKIVAHNNPEKPTEKLQHVGFGTSKDFDGTVYPPVFGADIPESFRLQKSGTGIFIIGFKEERNWQEIVVRSITRNFFVAIHDKKLSVRIGDTEITHETLNECFDLKDARKQYYDLYRDSGQLITVKGGGGGSWRFCLKIAVGNERMDNRVVYVNRRGMLITDEKRFSKNPFSAQFDMGRYVAVIWAADDTTDAVIRDMEPPTHESIEYKRIEEPDKREKIRKQLREVSEKIRDHIKQKLDLETFDQRTELRELSDIIPYVSDPDKNNMNDDDKIGSSTNSPIIVRTVQTGDGTPQVSGTEEEDDDAESTGGKDGKGGDKKRGEHMHATNKKTTSNMANIRVVRHGGGDALRVAFDTKTGANKFVIKSAGEEYKNEPPIEITGVQNVSGARFIEVLDKYTTRVNAEPNSRVVLDVSPNKMSEYTAYTILEYRARRTIAK